jgi:hypothetical protein
LPLTQKIGSIAPDGEKFASWSGPIGYYPRASSTSPSFQSDKMLNSSFNLDELILNRSVCSRLMNRNKNLVEFKSTPGGDDLRRSFARSNCIETHVNHAYYREIMNKKGTIENFRKSFTKFRKHSDEIDSVSFYEIDLMVKDCLGDDAPDLIVSKFKEFCSSYAVRGEVYWKDFW